MSLGSTHKPTRTSAGRAGWPFAHDIYARLIDRLRKAGVKVIALDIQFSERSDFDKESLALLDVIERAGTFVESTTEVDDLGNGNAFTYYVPPRIFNSKGKPRSTTDRSRYDLNVVIANGVYQTTRAESSGDSRTRPPG